MSKVIPNGNVIINNSNANGNSKRLSFIDEQPKPKLNRSNTLTSDVASLQKSSSNQSVTSQNYSNILKTVGKKIRKTKAELDRSGWIHGFYILLLVIYSVLGGALFLALDGKASERAIANYDRRCVDYREMLWTDLTYNCSQQTFEECQTYTRSILMKVDRCLRSIDRTVTVYSTSIYLNSLIYAITVYTTIGYGTISMSSTAGRAATIVYTVVGTPLFFAFLNDMGQWFQRMFLKTYAFLRKFIKHTALYNRFYLKRIASTDGSDLRNTYDDVAPSKTGLIFTCSVIFLILYFLMVSTMFSLIEDWNFFESFYFVFQSIALIGFGDVFPDHPNTVLFTIIFIIVGISLLSMCFFILQEWIREKTSRLSKQFRCSVRQWREHHPFHMYHLSHSYWSSRIGSRRPSAAVVENGGLPRVSFNMTVPNSLSASKENSPSLNRAVSMDALKKNSLGKAIAAGRFQFISDLEQYSDDSG